MAFSNKSLLSEGILVIFPSSSRTKVRIYEYLIKISSKMQTAITEIPLFFYKTG